MNNNYIDDLAPILQAQNHQINTIRKRLNDIEDRFDRSTLSGEVLTEIDDLLYQITNGETLSDEDYALAERNAIEIENVYEKYKHETNKALVKLRYNDWNQYVVDCYKYDWINEIDPLLPFEMLLSDEDMEQLKKSDYHSQYAWEKVDYFVVGIAGIVAILTDYFIVSIPKDITSGLYKGQKGSPLTKWLQSLRLPKGLQTKLEKLGKATFDNTGGSLHRMDTPGHDIVLGLIFGVIDIFGGTSTDFKGGVPNIKAFSDILKETPEFIQNGATTLAEFINSTPDFIKKDTLDVFGLIEAFIIEILHLISDVCTKNGLPVPFACLTQLMKFGKFKRANGKTATIAEMGKYMYYQGYDLRHFVTMGVVPAVIELIVRGYFLIKHFIINDDMEIKTLYPKLRSMLLVSHTIASAGNAGKIALKGGNPLSFNYAEWLMLVRYLIPSLKYWLFTRDGLEVEYLRKMNEEQWNDLLLNSRKIMDKISDNELDIMSYI
jgi:hypothetical protein